MHTQNIQIEYDGFSSEQLQWVDIWLIFGALVEHLMVTCRIWFSTKVKCIFRSRRIFPANSGQIWWRLKPTSNSSVQKPITKCVRSLPRQLTIQIASNASCALFRKAKMIVSTVGTGSIVFYVCTAADNLSSRFQKFLLNISVYTYIYSLQTWHDGGPI